MSTDLAVETTSDDNQRSYFRSLAVRAVSKRVETPTRALEPRRAVALPKYDTSPYSVVEQFGEFDEADLERLLSEPTRLDSLAARFRSLDRAAPGMATRMYFTQFRPGRGRVWPDRNQLALLTDIVLSYSDIVPIPGVACAVNSNQIPALLSHVREALRLIERLNNKPLMGWIPVAMPRPAIPKLVNLYIEQNVSAYCVDFAGRIPTHLQMRPILTSLADRGRLEKSMLYGLNARPGKFIKNCREIPSRDFFAFGYGLDVLGGSHLRAFVPPNLDEASRLGRAVAARESNRSRVFLRSTYGYHRIDSRAEGDRLLPKRGPVSIDTLLGGRDHAVEKVFSMDQQSAEAGEIRRRLGQLGRRESILEYVAGKRLASEALPHFRRVRTLM